ncbi:hypothetical protein BD779DRAFT_919474 [Infundibulicybe gibba]|nr:hypothetical protein BD779DRAFT_919474 [Infundibulicybe gibba]
MARLRRTQPPPRNTSSAGETSQSRSRLEEAQNHQPELWEMRVRLWKISSFFREIHQALMKSLI